MIPSKHHYRREKSIQLLSNNNNNNSSNNNNWLWKMIKLSSSNVPDGAVIKILQAMLIFTTNQVLISSMFYSKLLSWLVF